MASITHDPKPALTATASNPAASVTSPVTVTSPRPAQTESHRSPSPHAIPKPSTPIYNKQYNIPKFELTGAAAMAENRRHEEEVSRQTAAAMTSPNPAKTALMTAPEEAMSRPSDAPLRRSPAPTQESDSAHPKNVIVAEPMQIDGEHQNGAMVTSSPEPGAQIGAGPETVERTDSKKRPGSPSLTIDDRSNKAFTYPPPPEQELPTPARNMSLPNAGTRSPSTKKHRCPHCATEFTRHHNLKSHLLTHSQEKPYGCEQCSQRFRRLHDLKRHLKLHTGERPHTCNVCGRKFARGDALARHNKGPGGCAGRRESAGGDDDYGDLDGDVDMEGAYDSQEGLSNDEQMTDLQRRKSEPNKRGRRTSSRVDPQGTNFRHSSTYPPVAPMSVDSRADMPPPGSGNTTHPRETPSQRHLSPHPQGTSFNAVHYNGPTSVYSRGGMTESPKPLSPGQPDPGRHNSDAAGGRNRSPSLATKLQHQHFNRSTGGNTPPMSLPPPVPSHQQLPSISGFDSRFGASSYQSNTSAAYRPPVVSTQHASGSSGPPSASSQHQSSGGSARETFGNGFQQDEARLMDYVRSLETRLHEEKTARVTEREERDNVIRTMQHEIEMLKSQVPKVPSQQGHRSSH